MQDTDTICEEEINLLNRKINYSSQFTNEISSLFKDFQIIKSSLDLFSDYINRKEYMEAYKTIVSSLTYAININEQILEKYTELQNLIKDLNEQSSEKN
jgi:hypothetical protein